MLARSNRVADAYWQMHDAARRYRIKCAFWLATCRLKAASNRLEAGPRRMLEEVASNRAGLTAAAREDAKADYEAGIFKLRCQLKAYVTEYRLEFGLLERAFGYVDLTASIQ